MATSILLQKGKPIFPSNNILYLSLFLCVCMFVSVSVYMSGMYGGCKLFFFKQITIVKHVDGKLPLNPARIPPKKKNIKRRKERK